ncbi:hypothetical protein AB1283_04250 [Bacillus sp. S13(2024)]|uniref:hypothetical protein n=1 Tax=unclassified Bacillus (in: firmicutes) TaxID=185979 RepID=UPI003D251435
MAKSILINNDGLVIGYSDNIQIIDENTVAVSPNKRFAKSAYSEIVEVIDVPGDYEDYKYKYNKINGFTLNESWIDPNFAVDPIEMQKKLSQLSDENNSLKNQLARTNADFQGFMDLVFNSGVIQ